MKRRSDRCSTSTNALTLRSRTGAAKPKLWPTLNPCHFTVPCFIFKTKTFSFSSKQALSNNVFGVKIGRTTTLRRLFKVINFRRLKFVCTLWPCPVFGMRAAGLATHLTTPVCPVARTQTIILQVVYWLSQIPHYKIDGSLVNFRHRLSNRHGKPWRMLISTLKGNIGHLLKPVNEWWSQVDMPGGYTCSPRRWINCILHVVIWLLSLFSVLWNLLRLVWNEKVFSPWRLLLEARNWPGFKV